MNQRILFTMCNQDRHGRGRTHCLGALDVDRGVVNWIRSGTTRRDYGLTGIAGDENGVYCAVQARDDRIRIIRYDPHSFVIRSCHYPDEVSDPHSMCIHDGELLIASTANNGIYRLVRKNGDVVGTELFWRYPGASDQTNEVHLNCLASHDSELFATAFGRKAENEKSGRTGELVNITRGNVCLSNLNQPHSILFHNGQVYTASSASAEVVVADPDHDWSSTRIALRGYTRGLAPWGKDVLVGISAHRKRSRSQGTANEPDDRHYPESEIVLLKDGRVEERLIVHTSAFGNEVYELLQWGVPENLDLPAPWGWSRAESWRTALQGM